jgi:TP901 family phage tail tape measure protein
VLPGVVDLATASEIDLNAAAEMATKSLGAFGLKTDDTAKLTENLARVNNVMAMSAGKTEASMEGLFESIKEGGPISVAAGQSMETFMAMASKLAAAGIEGSVAGTTLKNVFTSFSTKKGQNALRKIGVATQDSNGKMLDAIDIIQKLEEKTKGMGSAKRLATLEGIFGKIPLAGVSKLLEVGADSIREFRGELNGAVKDNAMGKLAASMRDTVAGDIDELSSAIDGVKIALFTTNNPEIRAGLTAMTDWVRDMKPQIITDVGNAVKFVGENLGTIVTTMKWVAGFAALFYAWATAIKVVQGAIITYNAAVVVAAAATAAWKWMLAPRNFATGAIKEATGQLDLFATAAENAAGAKGVGGILPGLNASKLGKAINGIQSRLGAAGMLGAAAGVGFAFGTWLNNTFALDEKISGWIAGLTGIETSSTRWAGARLRRVCPRAATSISPTARSALLMARGKRRRPSASPKRN